MTARAAIAPALAIGGLLAGATPAQADLFKVDKFAAYADFRLRAETDWDSQDGNGVPRDDRTRMRIRARAGFRFDPNDTWRFEMRGRTGSQASQQSPHITIIDFDGNDTGDASFDLDRWYVRGKHRQLSAWAGRNSLPFWRQNELLFDDDATMAGAAALWEGKLGTSDLVLSAGYFSLPVGMRAASGTLGGGQLAFQPQVGGTRLAFAFGAFRFNANPNDPDGALLQQGNGRRDYTVLSTSVQARWTVEKRPLAIGIDVLHNAEDYSPTDADAVTAANHDQKDGFVAQVNYGGLSNQQWLVGYTYARIETLAVNNSYSQDDWVRWGSADQTRGSNMKGHELRSGWGFTPQLNLLVRLYLVEAVRGVEDGKRLRADLNWTF